MSRRRRPNAPKYHDPSPAFLRALMQTIGKPIPEVAKLLGVDPRTLQRYLQPRGQLAPYCVQYTLEALAEAKLHDSDIARTRRKPRVEVARIDAAESIPSPILDGTAVKGVE